MKKNVMKISNTYDYQKLRGLKRKLKLIEERGGCCEICGYNKNVAGFDFHHKDPKEKDYQLDMRRLSNSSMFKLLKEVDKCMLLCANCHREMHFPDLDINKVRDTIKFVNDSVLKVKVKGKPKCIDCGCEINYTHKRCKPCNNKNKIKVNKPDINTLKKEIETHTKEWCSKKYGVSRTTIRRWLLKK